MIHPSARRVATRHLAAIPRGLVFLLEPFVRDADDVDDVADQVTNTFRLGLRKLFTQLWQNIKFQNWKGQKTRYYELETDYSFRDPTHVAGELTYPESVDLVLSWTIKLRERWLNALRAHKSSFRPGYENIPVPEKVIESIIVEEGVEAFGSDDLSSAIEEKLEDEMWSRGHVDDDSETTYYKDGEPTPANEGLTVYHRFDFHPAEPTVSVTFAGDKAVVKFFRRAHVWHVGESLDPRRF